LWPITYFDVVVEYKTSWTVTWAWLLLYDVAFVEGCAVVLVALEVGCSVAVVTVFRFASWTTFIYTDTIIKKFFINEESWFWGTFWYVFWPVANVDVVVEYKTSWAV